MENHDSRFVSSKSQLDGATKPIRFAWNEYRLLLYSGLIGIVGGLGAQVFVWLLNLAERLLLVGIAGYQPPEPGSLNPQSVVGPWGLWLIPLVTTLGGLLSGFLVYTFAPEAEGHGTDAAVEAFHFKGGKIRPIVPLIKAIASAITIGSGGAAGREGPTAQISVGVGSIFADFMHLPDEDRRTLVLAGMAAGLAAIFRSPLGMAIFAVEILYSGMAFETEALIYTVIASVIAYAVNGLFVGLVADISLPINCPFYPANCPNRLHYFRDCGRDRRCNRTAHLLWDSRPVSISQGA